MSKVAVAVPVPCVTDDNYTDARPDTSPSDTLSGKQCSPLHAHGGSAGENDEEENIVEGLTRYSKTTKSLIQTPESGHLERPPEQGTACSVEMIPTLLSAEPGQSGSPTPRHNMTMSTSGPMSEAYASQHHSTNDASGLSTIERSQSVTCDGDRNLSKSCSE
ncbi:hypothetical protein ElyMa_004695800 [Elysia marginata]|uniref:Uncharacterized protein n=1 Tax=Elysia marginata TaxID=1093978 RepID=A0AAV4I7S3_9GAST|nr:hypothetical protein ElyMa_004695800 [Elysia marginata]